MSIENTSTAPALDRVISILHTLKPYLHERWGVTELAVFGSVARGEAGIESDVDILFDYDRPLGLGLVALADFLEEKLGCDVDLLSKKAVRPRTWDFILGTLLKMKCAMSRRSLVLLPLDREHVSFAGLCNCPHPPTPSPKLGRGI